MAESSAGKLVAAFVLLIIGIVLVAQTATIGSEVTSKTSSSSESQTLTSNGTALNTSGMIGSAYSITNYPTSWKIQDCPITAMTIKNSSGSALVEDTDFLFTESNGTFTLLPTTKTRNTLYPANISYQTYQYCDNDYMNLSWGRTGVNLVPGFFALAMLLISVGLFYSVARDTGLLK